MKKYKSSIDIIYSLGCFGSCYTPWYSIGSLLIASSYCSSSCFTASYSIASYAATSLGYFKSAFNLEELSSAYHRCYFD